MGDNRDGDAIFKKILEETNYMDPPPLFVVDNGDLVPAGLDSQYQNFLSMISHCRSSFLTVPGNHDYDNGGASLYRKYFGDPYYYFDLGPWRFIMLDNASGAIDDKQLNWLEELLAAGRKSFLFMHMPPKMKDWWHGFTDKEDAFVKLVGQKNVQAVFCGHIHAYGEREHMGARYIVSGGAGAPLHSFFQGAKPIHHYLVVTVKRSGEWSYVVKQVEQSAVKNIAAIVTVYHHNSHADVLVSRLLQTDTLDDKGNKFKLKLASLYTDQVLKDRPDLSKKFAEKYGFRLCGSIEEALTLGTGKLAVDGVLLLCEGGDYAVSKIGQFQYPKRKFFDKIVEIFTKSGRVVPIFHDKGLADTWDDAKHIYDMAGKMKIPLMAGSCLPVLWRYPEIDPQRGCEIAEVVAISYHTLDGYGFHALEMLQSIVERRKGGERGIKAVRCIEGKAVWEGGEKGVYDKKMLASALRRQRWSSNPDVDLEKNVASPVLFQIEYVDGLKASILTLNHAAREWAIAWRYKSGKVESTLFWTQEARPFMHFTYQMQGIEDMICMGKPAWPVERTLLTSGVLEAILTSKASGGKWIETPHLAVSYQTNWNWKQPPPPPPDRPIDGQ